jgi:epoxyqueuosine reductase
MTLRSARIKSLCRDLGCDAVGIAPAHSVTNKDRFNRWLAGGYAADMAYLSKNQEERFDPAVLLPGAESVIVVGQNYYPAADDLARQKKPYKVAKYAWGKDYHIVLRNKLRKLRAFLKQVDPKIKGRICVDTAPFMDVYWAQQAGLGWQGKNGLLISREFGPYLMIGSLIINHAVDHYDSLHTNHCGTCTACIDACPTRAIIEPYIIDARKCLSYWTIETKAAHIPSDIARQQKDFVFGCDICSDSCPFVRFRKERTEKDFVRRKDIALLETGRISDLSEDEFGGFFKDSPISRPGLTGIKRNIPK